MTVTDRFPEAYGTLRGYIEGISVEARNGSKYRTTVEGLREQLAQIESLCEKALAKSDEELRS